MIQQTCSQTALQWQVGGSRTCQNRSASLCGVAWLSQSCIGRPAECLASLEETWLLVSSQTTITHYIKDTDLNK